MEARRPAALDRWLAGPVTGCPCGREHRVPIREVLVGRTALDAVPGLVQQHTDRRGPLLVIADPETWDAAGSRVAAALRAAGFGVREALLPHAPHADDRTIETLAPALDGAPARIVAIGSGTINDLGKALAARAGVPQLTVGTAASMNGYTSAITALTIRGLKVTRPAPPPDLLVLDTDVLAAAPVRLTRAGFGDLCSKPVSGADWVLGHQLLGEDLCPTALALADGAVREARARAAGIGTNDPAAIATLTEALVLSGLSMAIAGASSPASGGEHLVSHDLDISAKGFGREPFLHGEQVAVGTLASIALYERIGALGAPDAGAPVPPDDDDDAIRTLHAHLDPVALAAVLEEARKKRGRVPDRAARRNALATRWPVLWPPVARQFGASAGLADDLRRAGVPATFGAIDVDRARAAHVLRTARHIRDRYTVLDLAADLGRLDAWADEIAVALA